MPEIQQPSFDAPIAGQSLTAEVGSRPWQNPAQYSTLDDALEWYLDRFDNDEVIDELLTVVDSGVSLATIANSMQLGGVMQGIHSVDIGVLIAPIIIEMLKYLAEQTDTKYSIGDEKVDTDSIPDAVLNKAINELSKQQGDTEIKEEEEETEEEKEPESAGLMARRQ
tara:strand:+ start:1163 stop:1663 length:501 start_codon:yes stop_codon:yes gene_type:complete